VRADYSSHISVILNDTGVFKLGFRFIFLRFTKHSPYIHKYHLYLVFVVVWARPETRRCKVTACQLKRLLMYLDKGGPKNCLYSTDVLIVNSVGWPWWKPAFYFLSSLRILSQFKFCPTNWHQWHDEGCRRLHVWILVTYGKYSTLVAIDFTESTLKADFIQHKNGDDDTL